MFLYKKYKVLLFFENQVFSQTHKFSKVKECQHINCSGNKVTKAIKIISIISPITNFRRKG